MARRGWRRNKERLAQIVINHKTPDGGNQIKHDGRLMHTDLCRLPFWKDSDNDVVDLFKKLLQHFQLAYPVDTEPDADLIVPVYWRIRHAKGTQSLGRQQSLVTRRGIAAGVHLRWEYVLSSELSHNVFDHYAVESYSPMFSCSVWCNCIESSLNGEFMSRVEVIDHDIIRIEIAAQDAKRGWEKMRFFVSAMERVLKFYPGLVLSKYIVSDHADECQRKRHRVNDAVKIFLDASKMNVKREFLLKTHPWLPHNFTWYLNEDWSHSSCVEEKPQYASNNQPESEREPPKWLISPDDIKKSSTALARGGFGDVYIAKWASINVVVKEITVVEMRQFLREVKMWRDLRHDNVVPFYGANDQKEPYFIVSRYAPKGTLIQYLKKNEYATWQKLKEVAVGLRYLHHKGIVHGDLKGNNVVISENGTAMLTDFGMSFSESGSCSAMKRKDTLGAMAWRAPEFVKENSKPKCKSDVFSLGMCIIEAVQLENPWRGYTNEDIRGFLRDGHVKVERPTSMTNDQWELVKKMIAIDPDERPQLPGVVSVLAKFAEAEKEIELRNECPY